MLRAAACRRGGVTPDVYQYLYGEILASRGRKFGNQIRSPDRQEGVSRFDAPRPTADTLLILVAARPR